MFTTIGQTTNACVGDLNAFYFPAQGMVEIADMIVGLAALIIGPMLFLQGYQLSGSLLIGISIFQSQIVLGNMILLIKVCRLKMQDQKKL